MWLIAESGSTKTEWRLFNSNGFLENVISKGLNPLFFNQTTFAEAIQIELPFNWLNNVKKLWFYSAGCGTDSVKSETKKWLQSIFPNTEIEVESDLLAAARATCGLKEGVVAILGTGSNSALYDGARLIEHVRPLGYILGDEGSGVALGKGLLRKLLRNEFSSSLSRSLSKELGLTYEEIIDNIYRSEWPNRFIASCTRVLHSHKDEKEINDLIDEEIGKFISILSIYSKVENLTLNFVGSVAYFFSENLKREVERKGLKIGEVVQSPVDKLMEYHLNNM